MSRVNELGTRRSPNFARENTAFVKVSFPRARKFPVGIWRARFIGAALLYEFSPRSLDYKFWGSIYGSLD